MKAAILAAGEGVRLQPITATRPKHLIKIGGKPILEHCLKALKASGVKDVVVVVNYMADSIRTYFGDGEKCGLKIEYAEQKGVLGTGNAVGVLEPFMQEDFLVANGDMLFDGEAVKTVIEAHQKEKPSATLTVVPVEKPENYGVVELDGNIVKRIIEKPLHDEATTNLANAGIYAFSTEIFAKLRQISPTSRGEWEIPDAIAIMISENRKVIAEKIDSKQWLDIGRPWDLLEANRWVLRKTRHKIKGLIENGAHLLGPVTVAETARIRSGAYIEGPALVDEDSDIGPNCYIRPYTSVGKGVRIGNACEIKNSLIMDHCHIGHLSYVGDSVLGERCNLGAGTITANYRLDAKEVKMMVKDRVVDTGRRKLGAILGDEVKTGINALFMPGIKIGNNSWIGPDVLVSRDLPPRSISLLKQDVERKV
jgi:UDP-N-acetylglucosamine diphosphorylase/glucosamine-1-phosphate N-acetyltransferase